MTTERVPNEVESERILASLGAVIRTRRRLLAACVLGLTLPILVYNQVAPPVYEATSSLVFEELAPTSIPDELTNKSTRDLEMSNRLEEMNSVAFASDMAKALPPKLKALLPKPAKKPKDFDQAQYEAAVIHENLVAYPLRNTNVVRIRARSRDPRLSMTMANLAPTVLEGRNYRTRQEGATDLRKFVDTQLTSVQQRLKTAEDNLTRYKNEHGISSLEGESAETLRKMTEAEVAYNTARADRSAAEQKLRSLRSSISTQRKRLAPSNTPSASSNQDARDRLVALEAEYARLSVQGASASNPRVVDLRYQIGQVKRSLQDDAMRLNQSGSAGDPITNIDQSTQQSTALQLDVESLRAREEALRRTMAKYRGSLGHVPGMETELARLTRERDVSQKIYTSLLDNREGIRVSQAMQIPDHRVVDWAQLPETPVLPRKWLNLALGVTLGLMLGTGIGLYLESGKTPLRSMVAFENQTGWPVLARVPATKRGTSRARTGNEGLNKGDTERALVSHLDPASAAGEAYYMLRTRLELLGLGTQFKSLLVTSTGPRDGKSSTLSNLAATFAAAGRSALVVDAELRRPVIHRYLGVNQWPGVSDVLVASNGNGRGRTSLKAGPPPITIPRENGEFFQRTKVEGVTVLASGRRVGDSEWETARPQLGALIQELEKDYDVVLVDSAPPILVHDTLALCSFVDAVIVVVNQETYDSRRLMDTKRLLERANANIVGAVINKVEGFGTYYYYYDRRPNPMEHGDTPMASPV